MDVMEAVLCEGCGHRMQWLFRRSPWGIARIVCCRRCDDPETFLGLD